MHMTQGQEGCWLLLLLLRQRRQGWRVKRRLWGWGVVQPAPPPCLPLEGALTLAPTPSPPALLHCEISSHMRNCMDAASS